MFSLRTMIYSKYTYYTKLSSYLGDVINVIVQGTSEIMFSLMEQYFNKYTHDTKLSSYLRVVTNIIREGTS